MLSPTVLACLSLLCFSYLLLKPFITYFRDPLRLKKYPSPSWIAATTPIWLLRATWSQKRSQLIHDEIKRLGDVIRVSPNHLVFSDPTAIKDIYGVLAISHGVAKDEFYDRAAGDAHDLVQLRDRQAHSDRRKALANAFAAKTVVNMEHVIRDALFQLLQRLDEHLLLAPSHSTNSVNLRYWLNFFTLDVIGDTGFGISMGFLQRMSDTTTAETKNGSQYQVSSMIKALHRGVRYSVTMANIPSHRFGNWLKSIISAFRPLARCLGNADAEDFENICIRKLRDRLQKGPPDRQSADFMNFVVKEKALSQSPQDESSTSTDFSSLVADSVMMMNAGSDTTAAALTSTLWYLMRNGKAMERLRDELAPLVPDDITSQQVTELSIFSYDTVKDLVFLRACIDESLRLRPPIAYQLPRLVSKPVNIAGHHILPGTVVAIAPYSVHRHPKLYPDADEYRPDRWVDFDKDFPLQRDHLKQYNVVFSQGSRACIGRHLAIVELQILVATMVMRYDMSLVNPQADLEVFERFNSNPGPMCVQFTNRQNKAQCQG